MFCVSESEAAAIRTAFDEGGEFSAAVELRRIFPGILDNAKARYWAGPASSPAGSRCLPLCRVPGMLDFPHRRAALITPLEVANAGS